MNRGGLLLLGAGGGMTAGALIGRAALWPAVAVAVLGLLVLATARRGTGDLVGDATASRAGDAPAAGDADGPRLSGLGNRVERMLKLAEEQAADRIAEAEERAARIVADARAEAQRHHPGPTA